MQDHFETVVEKHGEGLILDVLENWERHCRVHYPRPMTLEERWEHFICATDSSTQVGQSTPGSTALCKIDEKLLNDIERKAVRGMIAYAGYIQQVNETTVTELLLTTFDAIDIKDIPSYRYDDVIYYLMNFKTAKAVN